VTSMNRVGRHEVLGLRVRAQQLDRDVGTLDETNVLDIGVQDTGPDGGLWALAVRGVDVSTVGHDDLATLWTIRGAPHLYRRSDLPAVAAAVEPFSEADASRRIYDASKPLRAAGITSLDALDTVAAAMREIVTAPMVKGEVSSRLSQRMDEPFLRFCRPCNATHLYEMPFRLAAFRAGLELQPGTSPPVLQPISGFAPVLSHPDRLDVVRSYLHLLGPATPKHVADYLDAPVKDVKALWPEDALEVVVDGETRWMLSDDEPGLRAGPVRTTRLLGPFDLFLQGRDRKLLVPDAAHAKALWPVLGRPGAVLVDSEIAGTWRPRKAGAKLKVLVEMWGRHSRPRIESAAERLAAYRGVSLSAVDVA
jgi:hypothetical protein